jgi:hypothetical protein
METTLLTIEQMQTVYPNQWLLVACTHMGDNLETLEDEVIAHSTDRDQIYNAIASDRLMAPVIAVPWMNCLGQRLDNFPMLALPLPTNAFIDSLIAIGRC